MIRKPLLIGSFTILHTIAQGKQKVVDSNERAHVWTILDTVNGGMRSFSRAITNDVLWFPVGFKDQDQRLLFSRYFYLFIIVLTFW